MSKSCLLLEKLVICCYELIKTLKCDSAAVHILNALWSDTVTRHTRLWELFKQEHIVTYLTYERKGLNYAVFLLSRANLKPLQKNFTTFVGTKRSCKVEPSKFWSIVILSTRCMPVSK